MYENCTFTRFQLLSVEIVEEIFSEKVIHSMLSACAKAYLQAVGSAQKPVHFGRIQVVLKNS
jgi:hypothetical protein